MDAQHLLSTAIASFGGQEREGQQLMVDAVNHAICDGTSLVIQAGTGTGKSIGYLVPILANMDAQENPVIIATATLALQHQIKDRDFPRLVESIRDQLPREPKMVVAKGRSNYLCKYKLQGGYVDEPDLAHDPNQPTLLDMVSGEATEPHDSSGSSSSTEAATKSTTSSERTSLRGEKTASLIGKEIVKLRKWAAETTTGDREDLKPGVSNEAWREVSVSAAECIGSKCPMRDECFVEIARDEATRADIVMTNHAFLSSGTFRDSNILPEWQVLVVDEAHELINRVTSALELSLSDTSLYSAVSGIKKYLPEGNDAFLRAADVWHDYAAEQQAGLIETAIPAELSELVSIIAAECRKALRLSNTERETVQPAKEVARSQVQAVLTVCEAIQIAVEHQHTQSTQQQIVWFSKPADSENQAAILHVAPLSVSSMISDKLFEEKTVIATSATLTTNNSFDSFKKQSGSGYHNNVQYLDVGSPFNYPAQGVLYIAAHLPEPGREGPSEELLQELEMLLNASEGGALCLFSSRRAAEQIAEEMSSRVEYPILTQGDASNRELIDEFSTDPHSCLFGTTTFWQGVDVPGPNCRLVVIDRIPFPVPSEPISKARSTHASQTGGNGFMEVSATHAAVMMAQGAGRLVRSSEDKGVVAVLDPRLSTKRYGSFIRRSMPDFWTTQDSAVALGVLRRRATALNDED